jgi:hypothetical protein
MRNEDDEAEDTYRHETPGCDYACSVQRLRDERFFWHLARRTRALIEESRICLWSGVGQP